MLFNSVSLVTNIAKGYSLEQALQIVSECGFGRVEIASIGGMCEHVTPGDITPEFIETLVDMLKSYNLSSYAFSGHVDLTEDSGVEAFLLKMDLAAGIGCKVINTNAGPAGRLAEFRRNLPIIIDRAERLGLTVCLESHGDIIGSAKEASRLFKEINHPLIRMNYDTGNTYYYAKRNIPIEDDILYGLEYLAYIHIKDVYIGDDRRGNDRCMDKRDSDDRCRDNRCSDNRDSDDRCSDKRCSDNSDSDDRCSDNRCSDNRERDDRCRDDWDSGDIARYVPIGMGGINFPKVFASLAQLGRPIDCGLEIPVFVAGTPDALSSSAAPISVEAIRSAVGQSMEYLRDLAVV